MRQLQDIAHQQSNMATIVQLTSVFEGMASMRIAQVKNRVLQTQQFFDELWSIYSQLRVDSLFRFGRQQSEAVSDKELFIIVSASGGFSGDIDQRLVNAMLKDHDPAKQDIIVIGHHGAVLLMQSNVAFKKYFQLPEHDENINVGPLVREIRQYKNTVVYYQAYVSLTVQEVRHIELSAAVKALGQNVGKSEEIISEQTYIFEPSAFDVAAHLERSMLQIALGQVIFESKLAQYASRFQAMSIAHERADDSFAGLTLAYNRARRALRDEQLKQTINGLRLSGARL